MPKSDPHVWTRELTLLALTVFFVQLGQGLQSGVSTNFFVHELELGGDQVLWLSGIREIPGLLLIFLAALMVRLPLSRRSALAILLMALGYGFYALIRSYTALIAIALVASIGFHSWMPLQSSLSMSLVPKSHSGRILGRMSAIGASASWRHGTHHSHCGSAWDARFLYPSRPGFHHRSDHGLAIAR